MATKKATKAVTEDTIIASYMDYVLTHEKELKSIYGFCKDNEIDEQQFYQFFGSVAGIQNKIWEKFFTNTIAAMQANEEYEQFTNKDKMLTFLFSFFESLTLNRSYVLFVLNMHATPLKNLEQLKGLRKHVKAFATDLIEDGNAEKATKLTQHNPQLFSEGAWLQVLFVLKFWMDDESPAFEKTDVVIEKSVNTIFDVFDNTPLDNILDFGKFLFKEKFA